MPIRLGHTINYEFQIFMKFLAYLYSISDEI